jgi:uncharacterized membrane protein
VIVLLLAVCAAAWIALLVAAPILPVPIAAALYAAGSLICHQRPDRSFHLLSAQLPVCARCTGIYAGAALGVLGAVFFPRLRRVAADTSARMLLAAGAALTALTLVVEWSGLSPLSNAARFAAGMPLGCAVALVVVQAVATLHYDGCAPRRPIASSRPPTHI